MSWLNRLKSRLTGSGRPTASPSLWLYVRCNRCGEPLKARLNLYNDLSEEEDGSFIVRKLIVGGRGCYQRIEATAYFDNRRRLKGVEVVGGEQLTEDEYSAALATSEAARAEPSPDA